ncbi:MAG: glycosyltransferase family 4 protein [Syntrophobacteraceae bacterium]|nr:glycosyltransferase family 4 protein [Syntrophobacteraceae bacterium]
MKGHAGPSGYDRLSDFLGPRIIHPVGEWRLRHRVVYKLLRPLERRAGLEWYHGRAIYGEITAACRWLGRDRQVFHFLYGENSYRYLGWLKGRVRNNRLIATFHTPPARFREVVRETRHLPRLDAAVAVSRSQLPFLEEQLGPGRVFYVPHGIDVDYYRPAQGRQRRPDPWTCLFVGTHLRDFDTLARAFRFLQESGNDIRLVAVTSPVMRSHFKGIRQFELLSGVSDERLRGLYQDADLLVLPMLSCTANNSLLEAMACGLPIVCTGLEGAREYANEACAVFTPMGDAEALAASILQLRAQPDSLEAMATAARLRALELDWRQVAARMLEVYDVVAGFRGDRVHGSQVLQGRAGV